MKRQREREGSAEFEDADFAKTVFGDGPAEQLSNRRLQRKTRQFCRQVQRALNLALAESRVEFDLFVEHVSPAPDCGNLLVHVGVAEGRSVTEAMEAIRSDASRLRAEVAMAIVRKRAPQLFFAPITAAAWVESAPPILAEGGSDE